MHIVTQHVPAASRGKAGTFVASARRGGGRGFEKDADDYDDEGDEGKSFDDEPAVIHDPRRAAVRRVGGKTMVMSGAGSSANETSWEPTAPPSTKSKVEVPLRAASAATPSDQCRWRETAKISAERRRRESVPKGIL